MSNTNDFEKYKKLGEPQKQEKAEIWQAAIGLQKADNLTTSSYLIKTAQQNIEGEISIYEVKERLNEYYKIQPAASQDRTEEADKAAARITEILGEKTFSFSPAEYITIHRRLFEGVLDSGIAGKIRDYNIVKKEWVLNGETIYYASADSIAAALDYDFKQEKAFKYKGLTKHEVVEHIAKFISGIWQIHAFGEGNTRATAVFAIKYLRTFGFKVENDLFSENSWYFRNALVRANYNDYKNNIYATSEYLNRFFGNLLLGEKNILKNREMQVIIGATVNDTVFLSGEPVNDTVFSLIEKDNKVTAARLAESLGVSISTVKREIKRLKDNKIIERIGSDKTGAWKIIKKEGKR